MEAFGLGPLPFGWECKIEPKRGILYFINHNSKSTQWEDPRLASIATPPYHVAITQPSAYFEDTSGSRWSSPVPSLKAFSLHRRGSSPRLGGSPRIAPSPTLPRSSKRIDQSIVLQSSSSATSPVPTPRGANSSSRPVEEPIIAKTSSSSVAPAPTPPALLTITNLPSPLPERPVSSASHVTTVSQITTPFTSGGAGHSSSYLPYDRPASARSFSSSSYIGVPPNFLASCDTETAYRTLCSLFPTAGEQHIRHLFHKYHNRANLVMSALQVAKHPLATDIASQLELLSQRHLLEAKDGDTDTVITSLPADTKSMYSPYKVNTSSFGTESPARTGTPVSLLKYSNAPSSLGTQPPTRWGSPLLSMSPQLNFIKSETIKPPKSPKMKLKYLKGIFPAAEETFLLDVLQSCENNVQKASEKLTMKGFSRTPPPKPARTKWFEIKSIIRERQRVVQQQSIINMYNQSLEMPESPFPTPLPRTARPHPKLEDKSKSREYLIGKFSQLPERFIEWALEAADFEQNKAETLLQQVGPQTPDEFKPFVLGQTAGGGVMKTAPSDGEGKKITFADTLELVVGRSAGWSPSYEIPFKFADDIIDTPDSGYFELETKPRKKSFIRNLFSTKTEEMDLSYLDNSVHARGPNASLARGQNPSLLKTTYLPTLGSSSCRQGPNPSLRQGPKYSAKGPNASLAKGSMWAKAKSAALASRNNNNSLPELSVEG